VEKNNFFKTADVEKLNREAVM